MRHWSRRTAVIPLLMLLLAPIGFAGAAEPDRFNFATAWQRMDKPVADAVVARTWMWGPEARTLSMTEPYAGAPGDQRTVQYFDKARMEVNDPNADPGSTWYVTTGLLATELITGNVQTGPASYLQQGASNVPVAGDLDDVFSPTYATFQTVLNEPALPVEGAPGVLTVIVQSIDRDGTVTSDPDWGAYQVTTAHTDTVTNHTIAEPFWEFMNANGTIYQNGDFVSGQFFENPFFATGRPITEAYWASVSVGGDATDVLIQCFERRCLTYTPSNASGWQVEAGNVGLHYYLWRYGEPPTATDLPGGIYLVDAGNAGATGVLFGCLDSLVPVNVILTGPVEEQMTEALTALFEVTTSPDPNTGLTNALANSALAVDSVTISDEHADVQLSGELVMAGLCDTPRVEAQIIRTVVQFPGVETTDVSVDGEPLEEVLSFQ